MNNTPPPPPPEKKGAPFPELVTWYKERLKKVIAARGALNHPADLDYIEAALEDLRAVENGRQW